VVYVLAMMALMLDCNVKSLGDESFKSLLLGGMLTDQLIW
jgi:hypothetical protein